VAEGTEGREAAKSSGVFKLLLLPKLGGVLLFTRSVEEVMSDGAFGDA